MARAFHGSPTQKPLILPISYTFAHTFPTGTHAMWLYYWLASAGIDPFNDVRNPGKWPR
jgi:hypothetical protein